MTTPEERELFKALCLECLAPVMEKYHLHQESTAREIARAQTGVDDRSLELLLVNDTSGLSFQTISYGHGLGVTISRLLDGKVPDHSEAGNAYGLDYFILLRNPSLEVNRDLKVPQSLLEQQTGADADEAIKAYKIETYRRVFLAYAQAVEECASDVMQGDFSVFPEIDSVANAELQKTFQRLYDASRPKTVR